MCVPGTDPFQVEAARSEDPGPSLNHLSAAHQKSTVLVDSAPLQPQIRVFRAPATQDRIHMGTLQERIFWHGLL